MTASAITWWLLVVTVTPLTPLPTGSLYHQGQQSQPQQAIAQPIPTTTFTLQPHPSATPQADNNTTEADNWHEWFWPPNWSDWFLLFAGLWAIKVAVANLTVMHEQSTVAKASVAIADMALRGSRPYLLVKHAIMPGINNEPLSPVYWDIIQFMRDPRIELTIHNYGTGPALIEGDIQATLEIIEELRSPKDYTFCIPHRIAEDAIGPGEPQSLKIGSQYIATISAEQQKNIENGKLFIVVYGLIKYRDVFDRSYETGFCWRFGSPGTVTIDARRIPLPPILFRGPDIHNHRT